MTTKLNLSISSSSEGDPEHAHSSNTNISTSDPEELIAVLRQLSGLKSPNAKSCGCEGDCGCDAGVVDEAGEQEPANAPQPRTLASLRDVIDAAGGTTHTAKADTTYVPSKSGDNPLAEVHENDLSANESYEEFLKLEESLSRNWRQDKLAYIAETFDARIAEKAINKGKTEYRHQFHEFAIREYGNKIKVFPILEGRVMTQVPLYVAEASKLQKGIAAAAVALGLGGVMHHQDEEMFKHNPNIVRLEKQLTQTTDPNMKQKILDAIQREKDWQLAHGDRPRVAPGHERDIPEEAPVDEEMADEGAGVMHFKAQQARAAGKDSFELGDEKFPVKGVSEGFAETPPMISKFFSDNAKLFDMAAKGNITTELKQKVSSWGEHTPWGQQADTTDPKWVSSTITHLLKDYYPSWKELQEEGVPVSRLPKSLRDKSPVSETKKKTANNPYAIATAAVEKQTGDKPPLKKSTITAAHKLAKVIKKKKKPKKK